MNTGRTNVAGNKDSRGSARTGTPGNRESHRVDIPKTVHQASSNTGRSARPGNDTGSGMPPNPTRGGRGSVPTGGVPPRSAGRFNLGRG